MPAAPAFWSHDGIAGPSAVSALGRGGFDSAAGGAAGLAGAGAGDLLWQRHRWGCREDHFGAGPRAAAGWPRRAYSAAWLWRLLRGVHRWRRTIRCRWLGDEALLLAQVAPTWTGADRAASAQAAMQAGAKILLMDDGLQNPTLEKTASILVIDGRTGFGNGRVLPAGPLREPVAAAAARCQAAVLIGPDADAGARLVCRPDCRCCGRIWCRIPRSPRWQAARWSLSPGSPRRRNSSIRCARRARSWSRPGRSRIITSIPLRELDALLREARDRRRRPGDHAEGRGPPAAGLSGRRSSSSVLAWSGANRRRSINSSTRWSPGTPFIVR